MKKSLHYLLLITQNVFYKKIISGTTGVGLSSGQPKVLEFLASYDGCEQKEIATSCEIEPATVTNILLRMEKSGLIERKHKDGNRRSSYVYLTEKGKQSEREVEKIFSKIENQAFKGITKEQQKEFLETLFMIYQNMTRDRQ